MPPKVRSFLRRGCHEILPMRVALMRRHIGTDPFFEFCEESIETESHIFFECAYFASIWTRESFNISPDFAVPNFAT